MQQLAGATSEVKIRKLRYFWRSFRLQVVTDLTEEGKIGQFRRIWGPLQYIPNLTLIGQGGWYRVGSELACWQYSKVSK